MVKKPEPVKIVKSEPPKPQEVKKVAKKIYKRNLTKKFAVTKIGDLARVGRSYESSVIKVSFKNFHFTIILTSNRVVLRSLFAKFFSL